MAPLYKNSYLKRFKYSLSVCSIQRNVAFILEGKKKNLLLAYSVKILQQRINPKRMREKKRKTISLEQSPVIYKIYVYKK